jgi:hypothetical protein
MSNTTGDSSLDRTVALKYLLPLTCGLEGFTLEDYYATKRIIPTFVSLIIAEISGDGTSEGEGISFEVFTPPSFDS